MNVVCPYFYVKALAGRLSHGRQLSGAFLPYSILITSLKRTLVS